MAAAAAASAFAHLAPRAAEETEEEKKKREDEEAAARAAEETEEEKKKREDEEKEAAAKKAEDDKKKEDEARAAEGDDDEKDERDPKARAIRGRERARCSAIFRSPAAGINPQAAAHLAFETALPRNQAIGMLNALTVNQPRPTAAAPSLRDRMADTPIPAVGANGGGGTSANPAADLAAQIIAAGKKRRGEV